MNIKKNKKILILGVSYKKNIDDTRESPAISILEKLKKLYPISYFDPFVKNIKIKILFSRLASGTKKVITGKIKAGN